MRIVFVGSVDFSLHCLHQLLKEDAEVVAVVTTEAGSQGSDHTDLAPLAEEKRIPLLRVRNIKDLEALSKVRELKPDVIFVWGFSQMIPKEVLSIPSKGCIGTHPTLLPKNRGRHPLIWALVEGLSESGLTFFYLDEGVDSGDILWQKAFPISLQDDAGTLYEKIKRMASEAISEFLPLLKKNQAPRTPQDHSQATYWRKRSEKDGEIHWQSGSLQTYNLIRALTRPYVGAHTWIGADSLKIWKSRLEKIQNNKRWNENVPGTVLSITKDSFSIKTGDGILEILEWEPRDDERLIPGVKLGREF